MEGGFWVLGYWAKAVLRGQSLGETADGWAFPTSLTEQAAVESAPNSALAGLKQAELSFRQQLAR